MKVLFLILPILATVSSMSIDLSPHIKEKDIKSHFEANPRFLDDLIKSILEGLREILPNPFEIEHIPLDIDEPMLKIKGALDNIGVYGLTEYNVTRVSSNLIGMLMEFDMELPILTVSGHYDIDGLALGFIPIYGHGPFQINITLIDLGGKANLEMVALRFRLRNVDYKLAFTEFKVRFENFLGGGDFGDVINEIINNFGKSVFDLVEPILHDFLAKFIEDSVNAVLEVLFP